MTREEKITAMLQAWLRPLSDSSPMQEKMSNVLDVIDPIIRAEEREKFPAPVVIMDKISAANEQAASVIDRLRVLDLSVDVVHHLHHGHTPCDITALYGMPKDWPPHNFWSASWPDVTCAACREHAPKS